jgi:two-component system response regulator DctR
MEDGAIALLQKPYSISDLLSAIERALQASRARVRERDAMREIFDRLALLTGEERQVLRLIVEGASNKAIVSRLSISPRTVDRRRQAVLEKMQVGSAAQLASLVASLPAAALDSYELGAS